MFAASGLLIAYRWCRAQSLTSTIGIENLGRPGYFEFIVSAISSPEVKPGPMNDGPNIAAGLIVTISNYFSAGRFF